MKTSPPSSRPVRIAAVSGEVVLMVVLGDVERHQWIDARGDRPGEDPSGVDLGDVSERDRPLRFARDEDLGAVLGPEIGTLLIDFGRIVRRGEEDTQDLPIGDLGGIERNADRLGVTGRAGGDHVVAGRLRGTARITGDDVLDPLHVLEHRLDAPEASSGQNDRLHSAVGGHRHVKRSGWDRPLQPLLRRGRAASRDDPNEQGQREDSDPCTHAAASHYGSIVNSSFVYQVRPSLGWRRFRPPLTAQREPLARAIRITGPR